MNQYVVILDYSYCFHRCLAIALAAPDNYDLIDSTVYHFQGILRTLDRTLQKKLGISSYDLVFAEDRVPIRKLSLLNSYKSNRTTNHDGNKQAVKAKLRERGVRGYWCYSEGNEADDVIATVVALTKGKGLFSIIVTRDRDAWQLIDQTVLVLDPKTNEFIRPEDVVQQFCLPPSHIALHKSLWGDAGDCVPNVCPRTQKNLLPLMQKSDGTYENFNMVVKEEWNYLPEKCRQKLINSSSQIQINWQLVNLDTQCPLIWE